VASGVYCDIKRLGTGKGSDKGRKRDLALIVSKTPAVVAGMFTTNQVCAAPVKVCAPRAKTGRAQVIVVNPVRETGLVNFRIPSDLRSLLFGTKIASAGSCGRMLRCLAQSAATSSTSPMVRIHGHAAHLGREPFPGSTPPKASRQNGLPV
jgi:hypothetical protein